MLYDKNSAIVIETPVAGNGKHSSGSIFRPSSEVEEPTFAVHLLLQTRNSKFLMTASELPYHQTLLLVLTEFLCFAKAVWP